MVQEGFGGFGSVQGQIGNSGLRITPREEEDAPLNPMTKRQRALQFKALPQPYTPGGEINRSLQVGVPQHDFSPQPGGDATGAMPPVQMPGERISIPTYQEPERPGKLRTALGIGLSGAAGLSGQSQYAANQFFLQPEARAERDYARELATYSAREAEWDKYYDQVLARQGADIDQQRLDEQKRANIAREEEPIGVPYRGSLYDPTTEEIMYTDPRAGTSDTLWEAEREQAFAYWLQAHPGRTRESMTAFEKDEAITGRRRRRGEEVTVPGFGPDGGLINQPRGESYYEERPANRLDEFGNIVYQGSQRTTGIRPRVPAVNEEDIARVDEWVDDEKRRARRDHQSAGLQLLAPLPGTPEREAFDQSLVNELLAIEAEGEARKERLRSGTIEALPGEGGVLQYNIRTGRAE